MHDVTRVVSERYDDLRVGFSEVIPCLVQGLRGCRTCDLMGRGSSLSGRRRRCRAIGEGLGLALRLAKVSGHQYRKPFL